jgi:HSP20 family protein
MFKEWRKTEKGFFNEFEKELEEMNEIVNTMMRNLDKEPHIFGFSMMVGPDGVPHMEHFSNVNPAATEEKKQDAIREPYTSMITDEKSNELKITAEMPGIKKEYIEVNATENEVIIKAEGEGRKYYKSLQIPSVDPDSSKAKYNNGILEITFELKEAHKSKGKTVKIE